MCSAVRLKRNLGKYNGNYVKAITAYKGICKLGRKQARSTYQHAKEM